MLSWQMTAAIKVHARIMVGRSATPKLAALPHVAGLPPEHRLLPHATRTSATSLAGRRSHSPHLCLWDTSGSTSSLAVAGATVQMMTIVFGYAKIESWQMVAHIPIPSLVKGYLRSCQARGNGVPVLTGVMFRRGIITLVSAVAQPACPTHAILKLTGCISPRTRIYLTAAIWRAPFTYIYPRGHQEHKNVI